MSQTLIYVIIAICVILVFVLSFLFIYLWSKDKKAEEEIEQAKGTSTKSTTQTKLQGIESMAKFLDFDDVVDSMIVRKKRTQYIMVIKCKGVNYDLLGQEEKLAVENGFMQFLNTIRFPIQLYIQTRSLNLKDSIEQYEKKVDEVRNEIYKLDSQIKKEKENGRIELVKKLEFDRRRKMNILSYGEDVTNYVARMSQNRNVLQQNTYVVVAYYTSEFGGEISNYSKEEIDNIAFSELYTRAQTLIRGLASSGVTGRVINSEELTELLYIAYNRDDSELISVKKAVDAQYDSLYNTARDVFERQKQLIEEKVDKAAIELAANSITRADQILKMKKQSRELVRKRALKYIEEYKNEMTKELYNETKNQVENAKIGKKKTKKDTNNSTTSSKKASTEKTKIASKQVATQKISKVKPATGTKKVVKKANIEE